MTTGIYKITSPSNKSYIGKSINIEKRWKWYKNPEHYFNQPKLYRSSKKYGVENHIFETIEECLENKLMEKEIFYKQQFIDEFGWDKALFCQIYDMGGGPKSQETKDKISKSSKGISRNKNIPKPQGYGDVIRQRMLGIKHTPEHIENYKKSMIGKNDKPIICISTGIIYNSITEAAKLLNINKEIIGNNLIGLSKKTRNNLIFNYINKKNGVSQ